MKSESFQLMAITDRHQMSGASFELIRQVACRLKSNFWLQVREKDLDAAETFRFAKKAQKAMQGTEARLIINSRVDVARCLGPKVGVQLPEDGLPVAAARKLLGANVPIGRSVHGLKSAIKAVQAGADLITLAPIYDVPGKGPGLGTDALAEVSDSVASEALLFALGGIVPDVLDELLECRIDGVASIRSVWRNELVNANPFLLMEARPGPT